MFRTNRRHNSQVKLLIHSCDIILNINLHFVQNTENNNNNFKIIVQKVSWENKNYFQ
jgi:hypothetical protein